ncbi:MAG: hypothetical protein ABEJ93_03060 [Candidatus Nanohalobium sp.]
MNRMKGLTIISEALLSIGIIMVAMAFVFVGGNIVSFQSQGLFSTTQNQMVKDLNSLINSLPESRGSTSVTYTPSIDSYTLTVEDNTAIRVQITGQKTSTTGFVGLNIESTRISNSDKICITRSQNNITLRPGSCDINALSNFCSGGNCINNICQPSRGEQCGNSGGDCPCPAESSSPDASGQCKPGYTAESFINAPGAGDLIPDTVDNQCVNQSFVGVQNKGDKCSYDFECGSGTQCKKPKPSTGLTQKRCCPTGKAWNGTACEEEDKLKLVFVPLNKNTPDYSTAVSQQSQFFKNVYPINPGNVNTVKISSTCNVPIDGSTSCNNANMIQTLEDVEDCAENAGYTKYTSVIGIFQSDVCNSPTGNTAGWSVPSMPSVVAEDTSKIITAHEIGHQYGLNDEYIDACRYGSSLGGGLVPPASSNCLKKTYDGDKGFASDSRNTITDNSPFCAGGSKKAPSYRIWCLGNKNSKGGRDIMSYAGAPGPREFAKPSLSYLKSLDDFS